MRSVYFSALLLISSAFQTVLGATSGNYTYTVTSGAVTITSYSGKESSVIIPTHINGQMVKTISGAFKGSTSLTRITIPSGVNNVGFESFRDCTNLLQVDLPSSLTTIGYGAFMNCYSLQSINIPSSVSSIGNYAFLNCNSLTSFTIPATITSIGTGLFNGCSNLVAVEIPSSVTSIGDAAFSWCRALQTINLPNSITYIGAGSFSRCENLTSIIIPTGVTSIEDALFTSCTRLVNVIIPSGVTRIGNSAFSSCTRLASVTLPNSLTSIGNESFSGCFGLTSITLPQAVTSIGDRSFWNCSNLLSISIPTNLSSIGTGAFSGCTSMGSLYVDGGNLIYSSQNGLLLNKEKTTLIYRPSKLLGPFFIPSTVTNIESEAFRGSIDLTTVTIPDGVSSIGWGALMDCPNLVNATLPKDLTSIPSSLFSGCANLETISIPESVTSISDEAFRYCAKLTSIIIPRNVTNIGNGVFLDCSQLKSLTFLGPPPIIGTSATGPSQPRIYYTPSSSTWPQTYAGITTSQTPALSLSFDSSKGNISIEPNSSYYIEGTVVTIQATPKSGYTFTGWSGNYSALTYSLSVKMDSNISVAANFSNDNADTDGDGLTNYQEAITYGSNLNSKDSNFDGIEDGQAVALGYSPTFNFSALINHLQSHPPAGLYTATQMQAMAFGDLVLTKNANGSFTLNYDIEKSTDLQTWTPYQALSLPLTGLPTDKAFVRIKAKQ